MKTAMQEAIEYLRAFGLYASAIVLEQTFLEKERKQIEDGFTSGFYSGCDQPLFDSMPKVYYNSTYNHERS